MERILFAEWVNNNNVGNDMIYLKSYEKQIELLSTISKHPYIKGDMYVINKHTSKSIKLPVVQFTIAINGWEAEFTLRGNFHNWILSMKGNDINLDEAYGKQNAISQYYCEGFPYDVIFTAYKNNHRMFTIELNNDAEIEYFFESMKTCAVYNMGYFVLDLFGEFNKLEGCLKEYMLKSKVN